MPRSHYESLISIDRHTEELMAEDPRFQRKIEKIKRPLLRHYRERTDEELVAQVSGLGIEVDRETFAARAAPYPSAEEMAGGLAEAPGLKLKGWDFERLWIALTLLWERWAPDRPSLEMLDERIAEGYARLKADDEVGCCRLWLDAWPAFLHIVEETGTESIDEFDEVFALSQSAFNWVQDLEESLWNAGLEDETFFRKGIQFATEYLEKFEAQSALVTENMKRAIASFYGGLGEREKVDSLYEGWLSRDSQWGWGWIGWSDCYNFHASLRQLERAESLLQKGLSVSGVRDELDILDRLQELFSEQNREEDARAVRERIEALSARDARQPHDHFHEGERGVDVQPESRIEPIRKGPKVGRNEPCPCRSGKKFKKCCGR